MFLISLLASFLSKTLKMGQTSDPETLVIHQKPTPGNNPEDCKQHYDHGGSLQLHNVLCVKCGFQNDIKC
jgi:hypothetical protein